MNVRIECYLAILKKCKEQFPDAHFEVITRTSKSILSPSFQLLLKAKVNKWDFETYTKYYLAEIFSKPKALKKLKELRKIAKNQLLFLICYEKNPLECHRSIVKDLIENPSKYGLNNV